MGNTANTRQVIDIPVDEIVTADNDRKKFDEKDLANLAESIREHGLAQPITVRRLLAGYELVAGERRWRAHKLLGKATIDAIVRDDMDDSSAASVMLAENTARVDLSPIEEARAYRSRMDRFGDSVEQVAVRAGVAPSRVRWRLDLLRLAPDLQDMVDTGALKPGFAWELIELDHNRQHLAFRAINAGAGLEETKRLRDQLLNDQRQESMFDADSFLRNEEFVLHVINGPKRASRKRLVELLAKAAAQVDGPLAAELAEALAGEPEMLPA